ncbi:hypothetical protein DMP06_01590 [Slackia equolifaciens]|uniref:AIPR protein n=1 Tax=Slackia equolifaciens TaxID=498718 RepID=A0A3N0B4S6_9ACTN|nr:hypothetical protein [Slackia equolifaciens]RNL42123.1 hypothetical protein DMP06_01590 [Slackia equolifaciens]
MANVKNAIIKFNQPNDQKIGDMRKISGFVKIRNFIDIIDALDLEANPRNSKVGNVTNEIQDSIRLTPELLPFKTKGVLLAASKYEELERNRYRVSFEDAETEGILDGGHNTLAIGLYILHSAYEAVGGAFPKGVSTWGDFKEVWIENRQIIDKYQQMIQDAQATGKELPGNLGAYIPVELLLPIESGDYEAEAAFRSNLFDICVARNNNVQLTVGTRANQQGYFDTLRALFAERNPFLEEKIEWKTNEGGTIKIADIVALAWVPLSLINPVKDEAGREVNPPAPNNLYSGKGGCLKSFERLMSSPDVTIEPVNGYRRELNNTSVFSAFKLAVQMPELYDYIYKMFPTLYNRAGGSYGRITAVKKLNERKTKVTPFLGEEVETLSPDGFVTPLAYGLQALMDVRVENGKQIVFWSVDPMPWLEKNLEVVVESYADVLAPWGYDPQKVGKAPQSYTTALRAYKMALAGIF